MKTIITGIAAAMCLAAVSAESRADGKSGKTPAEMREEVMRKTGGFVVAPAVGRGIKIVDVQSGVPEEVFATIAKAVSTGPRFSVSVIKGVPGREYLPDADTGAYIVVRDDAKSRMTILTAPEQGWASVNVAPLKADAPDSEKLSKRVAKEVWRALVYMLGAGNNQMPACIMKPCVDNKDIDSLKMEQPCPDPFREMSLSARKLGIAQARMTSYRRACVEGWAPPPANKYQKAIWEEVHTMPTEPIKIKPETTKQK